MRIIKLEFITFYKFYATAGTFSDFAREQTFIIVNHRYNKELSTILTSNYSYAELQLPSTLGSRTMSRLSENTHGFNVIGTDMRTNFIKVGV